MLNSEQYAIVLKDLIHIIINIDSGLEQSRDGIVKELLENGQQINTKAIHDQIDLTQTRLIKIFIVKYLINVLGLQGDYDKIMDYELDLIYSKRMEKPSQTKPIIAGDSHA